MASQFSRTTRALISSRSGPALWMWSISCGLLGIWTWWLFGASVTLHEISHKARLEVQQAPHPVNPDLSGKIAFAELRIGANVRKGQVLLILDSSAQALRLQEEQARSQSIPQSIASVRTEIAALESAIDLSQRSGHATAQAYQARAREATAAVEFALDSERRMLAESKAGSVAKIDALRAGAEARKLGAAREAIGSDQQRAALDAQTVLQQQRAQIEALKRKLAALENDRLVAQSTIQRLSLEIDRHTIRSPIDGILGEVTPLKAGGYIAEGQKIATVIPSGELIVVAHFSPGNALGRLQAGQLAQMRLDSFPWAQYGTVKARVSRVSSEVRDQGLRVELVPEIDLASNLKLQHGLTGTLEVIVEQTTPANLVRRLAGKTLQPGSSMPATTVSRNEASQ